MTVQATASEPRAPANPARGRHSSTPEEPELLVVWAGQAVASAAPADDVVGRWKLISHAVSSGGESFDSQVALLQQRHCLVLKRLSLRYLLDFTQWSRVNTINSVNL